MDHQENVTFELKGDRLPPSLQGTNRGDLFLTSTKVIIHYFLFKKHTMSNQFLYSQRKWSCRAISNQDHKFRVAEYFHISYQKLFCAAIKSFLIWEQEENSNKKEHLNVDDCKIFQKLGFHFIIIFNKIPGFLIMLMPLWVQPNWRDVLCLKSCIIFPYRNSIN